MKECINRAQLIDIMVAKNPDLDPEVSRVATVSMFDMMSESLINRERIEIREFGSFHIESMKGKKGRNPKTGERLDIACRDKIKWRPGKPLRERVDTIAQS